MSQVDHPRAADAPLDLCECSHPHWKHLGGRCRGVVNYAQCPCETFIPTGERAEGAPAPAESRAGEPRFPSQELGVHAQDLRQGRSWMGDPSPEWRVARAEVMEQACAAYGALVSTLARLTERVVELEDQTVLLSRQMDKWLPADSAPKSGQHILVTQLGGRGFGICGGKWQDMCAVVHYWPVEGEEGFYLSLGNDDNPIQFTHWRWLDGVPSARLTEERAQKGAFQSDPVSRGLPLDAPTWSDAEQDRSDIARTLGVADDADEMIRAIVALRQRAAWWEAETRDILMALAFEDTRIVQAVVTRAIDRRTETGRDPAPPPTLDAGEAKEPGRALPSDCVVTQKETTHD